MNERHYHSVILLTILICPIFSQKVTSSLIFVIDSTMSMSSEIKNVLASADLLFDAVVSSKKSEIENFIIVTFNDPAFELRLITDNRDEFKTSLRSLQASGGGDCPEMAMSGIQLGLKNGHPYSYLFVFTDASAKDMDKFETVRNLALELNTQIHFLVTSWHCGEGNTDFSAFEKLAHDTGGEFFFLLKDKVPEIMKYVTKLVDSRKVEIFKKKFNGTDDKEVVFPADSSISTVMVAVTGGESTLDVKDKDNATVSTEGIANIKDVTIHSWNNTNPGNYTVGINSTKDVSLSIHGSTDVSFNYGFSVTKPNYFNETTNRPVSDQKSYTLIKLNTDGEKLNLQSLQFVDLSDNIILDKLTFVAKEDQYYVTEPIIFPKDTFKIVMLAENEKTKDIIKRVSLPIELQKVLPGTIENEAPKVTIVGETKVAISKGNPVQLKCRVTGYPKPKISWEDAFGMTLTSTVTTVREEYEFLSVLEIDKVQQSSTYICKASNIINNAEKSVEVETGDRFAFVMLSKDKVVEYNKEGKLFCKVNADPPAIVIWYLNGDEVKSNDNFKISQDGSTLTIKNMKAGYTGKFICEIRNNGSRLIHNVKLSISGDEKLKIDKNITEILVQEGSNARVSCRILEGKPNTMIKWSFKRKNNNTFYDIKEYNEEIRIEKVNMKDVGTYKCVAKNNIAEDSHVLDLVIQYAPVVLGQSYLNITQKVKQDISITCDIQGEPAPILNWFFNGLKIVDSASYRIDKDSTLTFTASVEKMGQYVCEGVNKLGSIKKIANISVFEPPSFYSKCKDLSIEVGQPLTLSCPFRGYPIPKINWSLFSDDFNERNLGSVFQLEIPSLTKGDQGLYTCAVADSAVPLNCTFYVTVKEPNKSAVRKINAVEDDKFLRIPCKNAAERKTAISWFRNEARITTGNEWHSLDSDGSLVIKQVKRTTAGIYACATEDLSEVFETFEVIITGHPSSLSVTFDIEYLIENVNATVPCKVAQETTDYVRWFKFNKINGFGKNKQWNPYNRKHSAKYMCRVNNWLKSNNYGVDIKTGSMPIFQYMTDTSEEHFMIDISPDLNCVNSGRPKPEVSWWKNDIRIYHYDMVFSVQNKVSGTGKYKCVAKNKFGDISRQFSVTANDCLLNVETDFDRYRPIALPNNLRLPDFQIKDGHLAIPINTTVKFFCNGSFNKFTDRIVNATCREGKTFEINRELVDFNTLKCKEALQPVTIVTDPCQGAKGKLFEIGVNAFDFIGVYEICFDEKRSFLYTEHVLKPWASGVKAIGMEREKWLHSDILNYNNNEMYDCKRQRDEISALLGRAIPGNENECYIPRQLVNEKDVPPGYPQLLTHSYLNIIPHWSSDATKHWDNLEKNIRDATKSRLRKENVLIITGVHYDVPEGEPKIMITDKLGNKNIVPTYLWKVIIDTYQSASVAIVQVNLPASLIGDIKKYEICVNKCDKIDWIKKDIDEKYLNSGLMVCCNVSQFESRFNYTNLTSRRNWLLDKFSN